MIDTLNATALLATSAATVGAAGYATLSAVLARRFTSTRRETEQHTPDAAGLAYEAVRFPARGSQLSLAAWYLASPEARGAVILVHGRGASKGNALNAAAMVLVQTLLSQGLSVLMLDLRGHGDSDDAHMTYGDTERQDVLGAVDWLRARGHEAGRIGVLGASMGAGAAIAAAAEERAIGAVVSDSAFADFAAVLEHNFPRVMRTRLALLMLPGALWMAQRMTGVALHKFRPVDLVARLDRTALLLIHARGDRFITVAHAHRLAQASGRAAWVSDCDDHVGTFLAQPEAYVARVSDFFTRHLLALETAHCAEPARNAPATDETAHAPAADRARPMALGTPAMAIS